MTDIVKRLREGDLGYHNAAADEIERLRAAVALSVYELHFVADEHDCEQCREAAKKIMKTAKGGHDV